MFIYISAICLLGFLVAFGCKGIDNSNPLSLGAVSLLGSGASLFGIAAAAFNGWIWRCAWLTLGAVLFGAQFLIYILRAPTSSLAYVDWWESGPELFYRGSFPMLLVFGAIVLQERRAARGLDRRIDSLFASIARLQFGLGHLLSLTFVAAVILTLLRVKTPYLNSIFPWLVRLNDFLIGAACEAAVALGVVWIGRDSQKTFARFAAATLFAVGVGLIEPYKYKMNWQDTLAWVVQSILQAWIVFVGVVYLGKRNLMNRVSLSLSVATVVWCSGVSAAEPESREPRPLVIAANVDGDPVYAGEVADVVQRLRLGDKLPESDLPRLEAHVLNQLIDERLALHYLARHGEAVSQHHVDAAVAEVNSTLQQKKIALGDYLAQRGFTEAALRTQLTWRMSWDRYLAKRVTDDVLQRHFDAHRRDFDGTKVRVRHILLRVPKTSPDAVAAVKQQANRMRDEIVAGNISFADSAAQHSTAPTAKAGGEIGLISRYGEMVEPFAAAAFALQLDEISQPVETPFGIHLIQCTEIKPGDKKWTDVADGLRSAVIQRGFRAIVQSERQRVKVEFTGRTPCFDPVTGQLKLPAR